MATELTSSPWHFKIKPVKVDNCGCDNDARTSFFQSKTFLSGVTVFVVLSLVLPYYAC